MHINFEFKARCEDIERLEQVLLEKNPVFIGLDHQVDTYFMTNQGRLKLREGNIENSLIYYERSNVAGAKQSDITLYPHQPDGSLKSALIKALGVKVVVDKRRKIYFIDNVKFHFDQVESLGSFIEVEAIDHDGRLGMEKIMGQCYSYAQLFGLDSGQFIAESYSDMLLAKISSGTR
jgi:adenylate cyclase, class 2